MFVLYVEGCNEVNYFFFVFDWVNPPVVDHKFKLRYFTIAVSNFGVFIEGLAHDSDQHVKQMDTHEECDQEKQNFQNNGH